jgi:uncharacterized protein YeeX (DUF496 family)
VTKKEFFKTNSQNTCKSLRFEHKKSKLLDNIISYIMPELSQKIGKNAIFLADTVKYI